jgi:broad specificity phosphatase PhoE
MKFLSLVRHGETEWHAENRYAGRTDVALTEKGMAQAEQLARWACTVELHAIWSSSLSRARLTAEPAAKATGLALQIDPRLVELDFGHAEGMTGREMASAFPQAREAFLADPAANFLPAGEDPAEAANRGMAALYRIADLLPDGARALVVGHNTLFRLLLCKSLGLPLSNYRKVFPKLANATMTELGFEPGNIALLAFNSPLLFDTKRGLIRHV